MRGVVVVPGLTARTRPVARWRGVRLALIAAWIAFPGAGRAAEPGPVRVGLVVPLTGPSAQVGAHMRNGFLMPIEEAGAQAGGRRLDVIVEDDEGNPSQTLTKVRKLVESDRVQVVAGVLLASAAYAVTPYLTQHKIPFFLFSAAGDLTQRKPSEYVVRLSWSTSQDSHPFGEYAARVLHHRRVATLAADYSFGWEVVGGFQRAFEENGGQIVQKLWAPLNAQDFGPYLTQLRRDVDAVFLLFFGAQAIRVMKQYQDFGLRGRIPVLGGGALTEAVFPQMGDEAIGTLTTLHYSEVLPLAANQRFAQRFRARYGILPSYYAADHYVMAQGLLEALKEVQGAAEDVPRFLAAARHVRLADTPRGPVELDEAANAINNVYIRKVERVGGELQNSVIYTYPQVGQFWKHGKAQYLAQPLYDRDYPPCRFCQ